MEPQRARACGEALKELWLVVGYNEEATQALISLRSSHNSSQCRAGCLDNFPQPRVLLSVRDDLLRFIQLFMVGCASGGCFSDQKYRWLINTSADTVAESQALFDRLQESVQAYTRKNKCRGLKAVAASLDLYVFFFKKLNIWRNQYRGHEGGCNMRREINKKIFFSLSLSLRTS